MEFPDKYIIKYWKPFLLAVSCLMLEAACDLAQPTIMSRIIDIGVKGRNTAFIMQYGAVMLAVTAIGAIGAVSRNIVSSNVSQKFGAELRSDLFKKIQSLSFENIDRFNTASLITRLTNDVTQVQNFVNGLMRIFVKAPLLCVGSIIMASFLNYRMALILAAVVPAVGTLILLSIRIGYPLYGKVQKAIDGVNGVMREYLAGVRVVKAFNRFDYEMRRFAVSNIELSDAATTAMRVMSVFSPGMTLTVNMGIIAVLWLGGLYVNTGHVLVGQVIAFVNYMTQILASLMMITFVFNAFIRAKTSFDRIAEVMREESEMTVAKAAAECALKSTEADYEQAVAVEADSGYESAVQADCEYAAVTANSEHPRVIGGGVSFEDVTFSYTAASGEPILEHVSFTCRSGETIGIIGPTGAGKSSLVNLIPRFYDVSSGCLRINGKDLREMDRKELREHIAVVPQKTVLFSGTILENIRWGRENADLPAVERAAKAACAHEFISAFPEGYNTLLGQGGVNLSGGQKQRIAIARALVREPRILILDDCTSAVDLVTEARIREALKEYSQNLTCFIISQRISSMMSADRIIVLDEGKLAGLGTHEELLGKCAVYREIYRSQIGKGGM